MTIHQLKDRCWELRPATDEERYPHYDTDADAFHALKENRENDGDPYPDTKPVQLDDRCWVVRCDGDCGQIIDEEDECWIIHHDSRHGAEETVASWRWTYSADGRSVFCEADRPEDAVPAPPTPAELEAAGQLAIPGVLS